MSNKRVIITGASGFIGANLTRRLLKDGHEVYLLLRPQYNSWRIETIRTDVRIYEADLLDKENVVSVVNDIKPHWIFHLAAYGAYPQQVDLYAMVQTNIIGTINLVNACLKSGFEIFVNTSTSSEYGFKDHRPGENEILDPNSYYAFTKASAAMFCRYTAISQNVYIQTLRLYSVYGAFEEPTRFIPTLILNAFKGKFPPLVSPTVARDFIYIEDVEEAYIKTATLSRQEPGAIYNVGTGVQMSIREVVEIVRKMFKIEKEPNWNSMPCRKWDSSIWVADNRKIRKIVDWKAKYDFQGGIHKTAEWFNNNPVLLKYYQERLAYNVI
jgi:nucleoside-diphosphate-sugar epimerase